MYLHNLLNSACAKRINTLTKISSKLLVYECTRKSVAGDSDVWYLHQLVAKWKMSWNSQNGLSELLFFTLLANDVQGKKSLGLEQNGYSVLSRPGYCKIAMSLEEKVKVICQI